MEGVDASGAKTDQKASPFGYDTATGTVRLILGQLASQADLLLHQGQ